MNVSKPIGLTTQRVKFMYANWKRRIIKDIGRAHNGIWTMMKGLLQMYKTTSVIWTVENIVNLSNFENDWNMQD